MLRVRGSCRIVELMSEVNSHPSPLDMLVERRQPPYVFETDIIEAPGLLERIENRPLIEKADLLLAALQSLPEDEATWRAYDIEPTPNVPCNGFAVGTIFGACALDTELSAAFIDKLEAHGNGAGTIAFFTSDSRLAYVALQRIKNVVDTEALDRYKAILEPYLPPIDAPTRVRDIMYNAIDTIKAASRNETIDFNTGTLIESVARASELLEHAGLNPQQQAALNAEIAGLVEICLSHVTAELKLRLVIDKGGSCKNSNYTHLVSSVKILHAHLEATSFLPSTILRELDTMAACKAEEYTRPRAIGEASHDEEMFAHAYSTVDAFLDTLIARRQSEGHLDPKARAAAQNIIRGKVQYLSLEAAGAEQAYTTLMAKMHAIFSAKELSERRLNDPFRDWRHQREATLRKKSRLKAEKSMDELPKTIHTIQFGISEGSIIYDQPHDVTDDVVAYLKQPSGYRKVLAETGMNTVHHESKLSLEDIERELHEWHEAPRCLSYYIEWSESTPQGRINPQRMVIMKEPDGGRRIIIDALDEHPLSVRLKEVEVFAKHAKSKGFVVHYDNLPECSVVVRPTTEILEAAEPDQELVVPVFLDEIAEAYAHILGLNANQLAYIQTNYGTFAFKDPRTTVYIIANDFAATDGAALTYHIPVTYHEGIKHLGLRLPKLYIHTYTNKLSPTEIRTSIERVRTFSRRAGTQPVPAPWLASINGMTRPYNPPK